ncbi:MAG: helix-turn-helix domain-containing protein [Bryobacteraceae bacterium]
MSTSPAPFASSSETFSDIFDRLLQSSRLLTVQELAAILNLKPKTIYSYVEHNLIPHFKIESNVRFRGRDVAEWLHQRDICGNIRPNISAKWNVSFSSHVRPHRARF